MENQCKPKPANSHYSIFDFAHYRNLDVKSRFSQENGAWQELQTPTNEWKVLQNLN
jgi:hypothetical protein